ncbi:Elongator complex protein 5 [Poronia punctata]|nr:Elongator complex protein 5 [Poronia punctata]
MAPSASQLHARSHALLLLQKLLNLRDSASPLTLVLDTLEQSGKHVLREFMTRALISKGKIVYVSFATLSRPADVDVWIRARGKTPTALHSEIVSHYPLGHSQKVLLIIDELNPMASSIPMDLAMFLSSLVTSSSISLVGLYHTDVPLSLPVLLSSSYTPHPLTVLSHLATSVLRVANLHHAIEQRRALNRSLREPEFGLDEGTEGVLVGLGLRNGKTAADVSGRTGTAPSQGIVLEMELRRRSGRAVAEAFVLVPAGRTSDVTKAYTPSKLYLLSDHPAFLDASQVSNPQDGDGEGEPQSTFNLGLTEKQRRDREGIVLPYFDAQSDIGAGEGGRILYEMGREDDFDDEEDEI